MSPKTAKANVTPIRQRTQFTCMSTSMAMALQALGQTHCDEDTVNKVMGAQPMKGASWENALACAQHFGMRATLTSPCTVKQLKAWTDAGTPVLIAWNPEGREWSHASLVFDVDDDGNVWVADPNIPDPDETVRVVPKAEFYSKWFEKWPDYLVRRPAMAIEREITVDGRQVQAGKKELRSMKDRNMSRFIKNGPVRPTEKSDATHAMDKAQWQIRKDMGMAGLPGAGMGAGLHKDKTQYDRKREKNFDREGSLTQPLMTRRDYGVTAMLNTTNFQRILKMAEDLPGPVEDYVQEIQDANPDYTEGQAWATAWSIYCKYKNPGSEHCQKSPSEYFKAAAQKIAGMSKKAGYTHYWEIKAVPTPVEWASLMAVTKKILAGAKLAGIVVRGGMGTGAPSVKADGIWLNGDGTTGQDHETFNMEPVVDSNFCKTNQKPYDAVVVSILAAAKVLLGKKIEVSSDGGPSAIRRVFGGDITAKFEKGVSMTVDEVAEVVGPEFKEMNENPPPSVVKVMEEMQGKTAAKRTTHLEDPKKPGFNLCGEKSYPETKADGPRETTCFYCKSAWEKSHGGHMASERLSIDMFADILKDSKFEKGVSVPVSELPEELQDNVNDPPPAVKKLTEELKNKQASGVLAMDMFAEALKEGKFEEGKPADPTENMSEEDAAEWHRQNDEHKDEFKGASTPAQRSDDENNAVVENFFHKSAAQPQGAAQKAIMGYLESHEPGEYALTDMARTMRGMHFKSILSAAEALNKNGLVSFDGVNVSTAKASKTADMSDLWVGWVEDSEGNMARFFPPAPRGSVKRQVMKVPGAWKVMNAGSALKKDLNPDSISPQWFAKLPTSDKGELRAFLDTAPGLTVGKTAATGLYGFTKATEGACGAGVNKLQKAAKKIAANLYAKDESSPSFLSKHAAKGGSKTASMLLKAMESLGPLAQINKTAGRSGTGLYGFSEKTAKLGLTACNDLHHEAGVIAGDLFARKGADPVKVASYLASHAKKAKCPYAALLGECAPDAPTVIAKKTATDFLASGEEDEIEGNEDVLDIVSKC